MILIFILKSSFTYNYFFIIFKQQVEQLETALEVQRDFTHRANEEYLQAERRLFAADKNLNRFAETLDDVMLAKETIAALDEEK